MIAKKPPAKRGPKRIRPPWYRRMYIEVEPRIHALARKKAVLDNTNMSAAIASLLQAWLDGILILEELPKDYPRHAVSPGRTRMSHLVAFLEPGLWQRVHDRRRKENVLLSAVVSRLLTSWIEGRIALRELEYGNTKAAISPERPD